MLKEIITRRLLLGIAAAGAFAGGAIVFRPNVALADQSVTWTSAQTFMKQWNMTRLQDGTIACSGLCRTATAGGLYVRFFPVVTAPTANTAGCLTTLAALCDPSNASNQDAQ